MKVKEINNKHYIDAKVVMLATDKANNSLLLCNNKELRFVEGYFTQDYLNSENRKSFHLYFTSNEEIKEGNYFIYPTIKGLSIAKHDYTEDITPTNLKGRKIIATTDSSLTIKGWREENDIELPQPSKEFIQLYIESYNKGEAITDVLVEIEEIYKFPDGKRSYHGDVMCANKTGEFELKLKDNTIIIKETQEDWENIYMSYKKEVDDSMMSLSFIDFLKRNFHPPIPKT